MIGLILNLTLILVLALTIFIAIYRFRTEDTATRVFIAILGLSFITECIATAYQYWGRRDEAVYRIANPIELSLYCLYFNYSIPSFRRRHIGWFMAGASLIIGLGLEVITPPHAIGSLFLGFEGFLVIGLGMYSTYKLFVEERGSHLLNNIHFWLGTFTSILWCASLFSLSLFDYFSQRDHYFVDYLTRIIWFANFLSLCGILLAFSMTSRPFGKRTEMQLTKTMLGDTQLTAQIPS